MVFQFLKNWIYRIFFKSAYLLLKLKEIFKSKKNWGHLIFGHFETSLSSEQQMKP